MYKVYFKKNSISFSKHQLLTAQNYKYIDKHKLSFVINDLLMLKKININIYHPDTEEVFDVFSSFFKTMYAAGGLVRNENNEYLFIYKYYKWDLPKGKIDPGETALEAARREVLEETGIQVEKTAGEIIKTYHIFYHKETAILKTVSWFDMYCTDRGNPVPQEIEDIEEVRWVSMNDLEEITPNTYDNIKEVLQAKKLML